MAKCGDTLILLPLQPSSSRPNPRSKRLATSLRSRWVWAITPGVISRPSKHWRKFSSLTRSSYALSDSHRIACRRCWTAKSMPQTCLGAPLYLVEQQGFRKILDTTFMIGFLLHPDANVEDIKRYFRALRRAQRDIDLEPERYKHYFLKELPEKYHRIIDISGFGP